MRYLSRQVPQRDTALRQKPAMEKTSGPAKRRPGRRGLARVFSLSGSEIVFLGHCLLAVAAVRLGLTFLSYNRVRSLVTRLDARQCASMGELRRVAWGVAAAARFVPRATCLTQALSGQYLLARQGNQSDIRIGIERGTGQQLKAHAWLVSDKHIVLGGSVEGFAHLVDHGNR
ncbi:MAG: lasso peptide biosynthesis B2 protein [Mesorhizobium sp.]|nr:lasso peptide biosynthesis B2 protein [bacterium M00.F.Ca.ET.205.01.1.1]TGU49265.1 lasso peptide biosynthesis B2 protein [bacterium M00.F.Ca.ET.152.01.1.1]TGV33005.1 lasso peptide biosynthesis B2 protein [Mesorhizobium sp. M00.F.Ca.ET.186.01.1.1]TGZ40244.1 lasso peptide biosynthesis B2 protein [bacterium M00.F.Ca.ET.162.01.1.1]TJW33231.1 MAG: lasso peptide biosynthesis B2 protein [Mesorhizobium sp.]